MRRLTDLFAAAGHPARLGRVALYLQADDGPALAWWLRRWLSQPARRRLAALLLAEDDVVLSFDGGRFHWAAPTGDDVTAELLASGEYTATEVRQLTAWIRAHRDRGASTVVEVGANIGTTTLSLAREGWKVLAIEPVPKTASFLEQNVNSNRLDGSIRIARVAVTAEARDVTMIVSHKLGRIHVEGLAPGGGRRVTVRGAPLADVLTEHSVVAADVAFVWCDSEGSEEAVISSGARLWAQGVLLFAECVPRYGTGNLVEAACQRFNAFVPEVDLAHVDAAPRPIRDLAPWLVAQRGCERFVLAVIAN